MAGDKETWLTDLARGNPVDLNKIAEVERQVAELERAGIVARTGFRVDLPLGKPALAQRPRVLANNPDRTRTRG